MARGGCGRGTLFPEHPKPLLCPPQPPAVPWGQAAAARAPMTLKGCQETRRRINSLKVKCVPMGRSPVDHPQECKKKIDSVPGTGSELHCP